MAKRFASRSYFSLSRSSTISKAVHIFVLALSRLVPISFLISLTLIGSRYLHDLLLRSRPHLARWAFAAVSLIGLVAVLPYAWRATLIVAAQWATVDRRWQAADLFLGEYDAWNGRRSEALLRQWAYVRMNGGNWAGAEEILRLSTRPETQTILLIGVCQFYEHNPAAEATLRGVPDAPATQLCLRDYLLGRIAEQRGDLRGAFTLYSRSAHWEPNFFPSTYQGVRLMLMRGDAARAALILDTFTHRFPVEGAAGDVGVLRDAIRRHAVPPDKEFIIVSS